MPCCFLCATSLTTMMLLGLGFRLERECQARQPPQRCRKRSAVVRPVSDAQQPEQSTPIQPPDGCPTTGGPTSNPDRRTGPRTEDLNTPPVRPALPAESNLKSAAAAFPRGRPSREQPQIRQVMPGQQGPCPQDFYGGKPRKSQTTQLVSPDSTPIFQTLRGQSPKSFNPVHKNLHRTYTKVS